MIDTAVACSFRHFCPEMGSEAEERTKRRGVVAKTVGASVNVLCTMAPQRQTVLCPARDRRE